VTRVFHNLEDGERIVWTKSKEEDELLTLYDQPFKDEYHDAVVPGKFDIGFHSIWSCQLYVEDLESKKAKEIPVTEAEFMREAFEDCVVSRKSPYVLDLPKYADQPWI